MIAAIACTVVNKVTEGRPHIVDMIKNGAIGTLREIHNWSMRPVWPQFPTLPADAPPVPPGFDWTLWLGLARASTGRVQLQALARASECGDVPSTKGTLV